MPRLIQFNELEKIPSLETIINVLNDRLLPLVKLLHSTGRISGAAFYGSVPRNEHSYSSDIDVLIRYICPETLTILKNQRKKRKTAKHILRIIIQSIMKNIKKKY